MPFTFVEIEERKTKHLALLFTCLILLYAVSLFLLVGAVKWAGILWRPLAVLNAPPTPTWRDVTGVMVGALFIGLIHWSCSTYRLLDRTLLAVGARPIDENDPYHARLANIIQEVAVATGGRPIRPYVISTPAVNACAMSDFSGGAAIAVTEGALAVLNRPQLESVVGHEAAHIVSGDSLTTSVFCGLFALHEEALKRMSGLFDEERGAVVEGRAWAVLVLIYAILALTTGVKTFCSMLISREKEYRADAVAVRLTRDPISLAEALRIISERWRGVGVRGESLSSLFIMDPGVERLSDEEGLIAELFSTHPPPRKRIALLLGMAHIDPSRFEEEMASASARPQGHQSPEPASDQTAQPRWMLWKSGQWTGPLGLEEIGAAPEFVPESWVRRVDEPSAEPAHYDPQLLEVLRRRYEAAGAGGARECPKCRIGLTATLYEGATVEQCPSCRGCYVDANNMTKIFARQEAEIPDAVKRRGDLLLTMEGYALAKRQLRAGLTRPARQWACPRCGAAVVRKFYTDAYPVEVDQCWECGCVWLNHEELEMLQYIYEKRGALRTAFRKGGGADQAPGATNV